MNEISENSINFILKKVQKNFYYMMLDDSEILGVIRDNVVKNNLSVKSLEESVFDYYYKIIAGKITEGDYEYVNNYIKGFIPNSKQLQTNVENINSFVEWLDKCHIDNYLDLCENLLKENKQLLLLLDNIITN